MLYRFIWYGKIEKVSHNIFMQPTEKVDTTCIIFIKLIKPQSDVDVEKNISLEKYLGIHSGVNNVSVLLQSNFTEKMIPNFDHLSDFYKYVIQNWKQVKYNNLGNINEIRSQFIWYNSLNK